jgi:Family of unknown function (DUF6210)
MTIVHMFTMLDSPEIFLVMRSPTGITYVNQSGGHMCTPASAEGYLVTVAAGTALADLREIFEGEMRGSGLRGTAPTGELARRVRDIVAGVRCEPSGPELARESWALELDDSRLHELDEAWIPVVTKGGEGVLIWANSD